MLPGLPNTGHRAIPSLVDPRGCMLSYADFIRDANRLRPTIVAHRGAWAAAPENSVAALEAAKAAGFEIAEIDVRRTKDGHLCVLHDDTCARMAGHPLAIEEMTWDEIATLRLRASDGATGEVTAHGIPRLEDALETAKDGLFLDLDVKHAEVLSDTAALAKDMGLSAQVDIKIKVARAEDVAHLAELRDTYGIMVMPKFRIVAGAWEPGCAFIEATGAPMVETKFDTLETLETAAARLAKSGIALWVNTLTPVSHADFTDDRAATDPDAVWGALSEAGASIFQTDLPEALDQWRRA